MKGFVYILQFDESGHYYIGSTTDIERRLKQHISGHTPTTKRLGIFTLVFSQQFDDLITARRIEHKIKSWKRKDFIAKIIQDGYIKSVT
jgi:putative endonuclease